MIRKGAIMATTMEREKISEVLVRFGIRSNLYGYLYIKNIIELVKGNKKLLYGGMMTLYKEVAIMNGTTVYNVESCIRSAIESAFEEGNSDELYKLFGNTIHKDKGKPTNKQFISMILEYLE